MREAAARISSGNNLKQIGLGAHTYHDTFKKLPYNGSWDWWGTPAQADSGSWAYQILPYVEQTPIYNAPGVLSGTGGTYGPAVSVPVYVCPGRGRVGYHTGGAARSGPTTDYAINCRINDPNGSTGAATRRAKVHAIPDGSSNTIFAGHASLLLDQYGTNSPGNWNETWMVGGYGGSGRAGSVCQQDAPGIGVGNNWGGPFPGGALFVLADGSVRTVTYGTDLFRAVHPSDGGTPAFPD